MKISLIAALMAISAPTLFAASAAWAQAPMTDNDRVTVRDVHLAPGQAAPAIRHAGDYIVLYVDGGRIKGADGKTQSHAAGTASFGHGGSTADTALDGPAHEVVVELKDAPSKTVPNTTGLPPAFPREGSKLVFENEKVRVWNYAWRPGKPTPMHFHNTEVVVVFLQDGDLSSTDPAGKTQTAHRKAGDIVFNQANRSHSELLVKGQQSGIMLELK